MAGKYYSSTPIGASMSNLAEAIGGLPEKEAKIGLLAQQRLSAEAEARTRDAHAELYGAQAADQRALTAGQAALAASVEDFIRNGGQTPPVSGLPAAVAPAGPVPAANVAGVGSVPGAAPTPPVPAPGAGITSTMNMPPPSLGGLTGALGLPPPVSNAAVVPPPAAANPSPLADPTNTGTGLPSLASAIAPIVQEFQKLPPATQQDLFAKIMGNSVRAGHEFMREQPKFNLAVAGGMNATSPEGQQPYNKARMTDWQTGAGEHYQNTGLGAGDVLAQKEAEAKAKDVTANRKIDVEHQDTIRGQNLTDSRARARGSKADKPMDEKVLLRVRNAFEKSGGTTAATQPQVTRMMADFHELISQGYTVAAAANKVMDESWTEERKPGETRWFRENDPDIVTTKFAKGTRATLTPEELEVQRANTAPPGKPKPVVIPKGKDGKVDVNALRAEAQKFIDAGKDPTWVKNKFKETTGVAF